MENHWVTQLVAKWEPLLVELSETMSDDVSVSKMVETMGHGTD